MVGFFLIGSSDHSDYGIGIVSDVDLEPLDRQTVIVGLFFQQAIALFVLKSDAGFQIFKWLAFLASDFLEQSQVGAIFFFDEDTVVTKHWFFASVLSAIIFFIAFVQMMYYLGVMQWIIRHLYVGSSVLPPYKFDPAT